MDELKSELLSCPRALARPRRRSLAYLISAVRGFFALSRIATLELNSSELFGASSCSRAFECLSRARLNWSGLLRAVSSYDAVAGLEVYVPQSCVETPERNWSKLAVCFPQW